MRKFIALLFILSAFLTGNSQILKKQIPDKLIVFTFDDATESQYSVVAPLLKQYGFGATFFVCELKRSQTLHIPDTISASLSSKR
jgi:peptidoglycan/xylan/chitin deacetylase (PgdA/CDA1 family)